MPITGPSNKQVMVAFYQTSNTTHQAQLSMTQSSDKARKMDILPALTNNSLLSIKVLSDNGYLRILHPHNRGVLFMLLNHLNL